MESIEQCLRIEMADEEESAINSEINKDIYESSRKEPLWVFGYGSLCWNPGFQYEESLTGYIRGFSRRFWQGNTTHRGTETKPGRVATLIEDQDGITWGKAFLVSTENTAALPYLAKRECRLGGYHTCTVNFYPRPDPLESSTSKHGDRMPAVLYIAVPENRLWLGAAPLHEIAKQILECEGRSGSNVEYLLKLADFMREEIPEALDEHLFSLERLVRIFASEMRVCLKSLMGGQEKEDKAEPKSPSFQFASRVPDKKLRCVNM